MDLPRVEKNRVAQVRRLQDILDAVDENALLIRDFKIDLPMVAALLTIVGYSLNDTIVVFDRIRENRGKLKDVTLPMINVSINQTLSRTVLTSMTTMLAVVVMYTAGGAGIHGFSFAMIIGVMVGTYSSLAIASPLLLHPNLLKWIIIVLVAIVLVGFALYMEDRVLQIMAWGLAGMGVGGLADWVAGALEGDSDTGGIPMQFSFSL